ncbi:MAG TPA: GTPase ObgE [Gemmatales bacterium]|nr:GTPase ObgE [Gemmatales bacterium]
MFVDRVILFVKGGHGGRGKVSFYRAKYVMKGPPEGGDGGNGGNVIIRAIPGTDSLAAVSHIKHWRAENGGDGGVNNRHGHMGEDRIIIVPPGTVIRDRDRGHILKDLTEPNDEIIVAKGGRGGRGNRHFATSINRSPREAEPGEDGEERWIVLELKLIADVGLVGLPNAGKSTMLSRLTRAQPEIADYPFTTKFPNLGVVQFGHEHGFVLADLPGLIEGAHTGVGLGLEFLRHVERTRVLIHLVEPFPTDGSDPIANYRSIRNELNLYSKELTNKPEVLAISKSELTESESVRQRLEQELGKPVLGVSAATGQGLSQLVNQVMDIVKTTRLEQAPSQPTQRPFPDMPAAQVEPSVESASP